jgi:hypothetical protein
MFQFWDLSDFCPDPEIILQKFFANFKVYDIFSKICPALYYSINNTVINLSK